jgi:non-homologous end joining protein Ku
VEWLLSRMNLITTILDERQTAQYGPQQAPDPAQNTLMKLVAKLKNNPKRLSHARTH